ncbi:AsmA-like C-terminal region-containing protein [Testudinibacter sp. P80/BLE/0925]|uniref:AsmA-like C-terminal region-containing protein n=1 Tax=Testudinibacter sp. TW-1 TaxID=3417757 RepID=UPI003D3643F5
MGQPWWKRRVLYPVLLGTASLSFLTYYQLGTFERKITAELRRLPDFQFQQAQLNYFPSPTLQLKQAQYHYQDWQFSAQQVELQFGWRSLLTFSPKVKQVQLSGGNVYSAQQLQFADLTLVLSEIAPNYQAAKVDLTAQNRRQDEWRLSAVAQRFPNGIELYQTELNAEMAEDYFLNNRRLRFMAEKVSLSEQQNSWQLTLQQARLNQLNIQSAVLHYALPAQVTQKPHLQLVLRQAQGSLHVQAVRQNNANRLQLKARGLALQPWLAFLQLPELLDGTADFDGNALFEQGVLYQGDLRLRARDTALNGLNLLEMISQYYPIRQGAKQYADRIATPFKQIDLDLNWADNRLRMKQIQAQGEDLNLSGKGEMNLTDFTCRLELRLSPTLAGYSQYQLPVSLFGPCRSPQYRISIDKKLGNQLKRLLKEKLQEKE